MCILQICSYAIDSRSYSHPPQSAIPPSTPFLGGVNGQASDSTAAPRRVTVLGSWKFPRFINWRRFVSFDSLGRSLWYERAERAQNDRRASCCLRLLIADGKASLVLWVSVAMVLKRVVAVEDCEWWERNVSEWARWEMRMTREKNDFSNDLKTQESH